MKLSRKYLQYLERRGEGKINWDKWDESIEKFHKWMEEYFSKKEKKYPRDKRERITVYAYNNNGELVKKWDTNNACAKELQCSTSTIHNYSKLQNVVNTYLLSREPLAKDVAFAKYREALHHGNVYQAGISKTKTPKLLYKYDSNGKMVGIYESLYKFCKTCGTTSSSNLRERLSKGNIITRNYLISYSFLDEQTAKEEYENAMKKYWKH